MSNSATRALLPQASLRIGMLSTYPPTVCGLATFAAGLQAELTHLGHRVHVVRVDDGCDGPSDDPAVAAVMRHGSRHSRRQAAAMLSTGDVAIIQHEYGIYGGPDGIEVLDVLEALEVPSIVVLHTVPAHPSETQAALLIRICELADVVVVMTDAARDRLTRTYYPIDDEKVVTIPHGALVASVDGLWRRLHPSDARGILTWGLLGPGKGVEHAIDAMALVRANGVALTYTIAGVTHPKVLERDGDAYRDSLMQRARRLGLQDAVTFDDAYRGVMRLTRFVSAHSIVVLPYDSVDQVTSGVLVDSIAAGRPVIATAFPHAVELLSSGAGLVVPHRDPEALADAIQRAVTDVRLLEHMTREARRIAPELSWHAVARKYAQESHALATGRSRMPMEPTAAYYRTALDS